MTSKAEATCACAQAAGVSAPATYNHFKVRDQLFGELAEGGLLMLTNDFLKLIPDDADVIPKGLVPDICKAWMGFAAKRPRHYALMFSLEFNDPGRHPRATDRRSKLGGLLRSVVIQELGFVPSAAEGDLFLTMLHGAASLLASGDPRPPTKLIAQAITRQLATLKKQRPAPSRRGPGSA